MTVVTDMWLAPNLPGYEEVRSFYTPDGPETCLGSRHGRNGRDDGTSGRHDERHEPALQGGIEARGSSRASGCTDGRDGWRYERSRYGEDAEAKAQAQAQQQQQQAPPLHRRAMWQVTRATGAALGPDGQTGRIGRCGRRIRWIRPEEETTAAGRTSPSSRPKLRLQRRRRALPDAWARRLRER